MTDAKKLKLKEFEKVQNYILEHPGIKIADACKATSTDVKRYTYLRYQVFAKHKPVKRLKRIPELYEVPVATPASLKIAAMVGTPEAVAAFLKEHGLI